MLYLAHLLNRPVRDVNGVTMGWLEDMVLTTIDLFPRVEALVLARRGRGAVVIQWDQINSITDDALHLKNTRKETTTDTVSEAMTLLKRDILDKQIVDTNGRKIVRINDLQFVNYGDDLRLIGADISAAGILRRMSLEVPARFIAKLTGNQLTEKIIPWNYVENLESDASSIKLNISSRGLRDLPAPEIADILEKLAPEDRSEVLARIDNETLADTLSFLEDEMQAELLEAIDDERASDILEIMPPDEAADALGEMDEDHAERLLNMMEEDEAEDVRELMQYEHDTAGGRMTTAFVAVAANLNVGEAINELRTQSPDAETVYYTYVVDTEGKLIGVLSLRELITSPDTEMVTEMINTSVMKVNVNDDQEECARILNNYHLLAIPVVDDNDILRGIVTVDDVLDVLHEESQEDISKVSGTSDEGDMDDTSWHRATHRMPWVLGVGLVGVFTSIMLYYNFDIANSLTALLPLILLLGVQLGGQGAAAVQMGINAEESVGDILLMLLQRQWPLGAAIALAAGMVGGIFAIIIGGNASPFAVFITIWLVLTLQVLTGSLLPLLMQKLKWDPALVSRPALAAFSLLTAVPLLMRAL